MIHGMCSARRSTARRPLAAAAVGGLVIALAACSSGATGSAPPGAAHGTHGASSSSASSSSAHVKTLTSHPETLDLCDFIPKSPTPKGAKLKNDPIDFTDCTSELDTKTTAYELVSVSLTGQPFEAATSTRRVATGGASVAVSTSIEKFGKTTQCTQSAPIAPDVYLSATSSVVRSGSSGAPAGKPCATPSRVIDRALSMIAAGTARHLAFPSNSLVGANLCGSAFTSAVHGAEPSLAKSSGVSTAPRRCEWSSRTTTQPSVTIAAAVVTPGFRYTPDGEADGRRLLNDTFPGMKGQCSILIEHVAYHARPAEAIPGEGQPIEAVGVNAYQTSASTKSLCATSRKVAVAIAPHLPPR